MPIIINLDVMLAKRKMRSTELAEKLGITTANLSIIKTGKAKAIRLSTLEAYIFPDPSRCAIPDNRPHLLPKHCPS